VVCDKASQDLLFCEQKAAKKLYKFKGLPRHRGSPVASALMPALAGIHDSLGKPPEQFKSSKNLKKPATTEHSSYGTTTHF